MRATMNVRVPEEVPGSLPAAGYPGQYRPILQKRRHPSGGAPLLYTAIRPEQATRR